MVRVASAGFYLYPDVQNWEVACSGSYSRSSNTGYYCRATIEECSKVLAEIELGLTALVPDL